MDSSFTNEIIEILTIVQNNSTLVTKLQDLQIVGNIRTDARIAVKIAELLKDSRSLIRLSLSGVIKLSSVYSVSSELK